MNVRIWSLLASGDSLGQLRLGYDLPNDVTLPRYSRHHENDRAS